MVNRTEARASTFLDQLAYYIDYQDKVIVPRQQETFRSNDLGKGMDNTENAPEKSTGGQKEN